MTWAIPLSFLPNHGLNPSSRFAPVGRQSATLGYVSNTQITPDWREGCGVIHESREPVYAFRQVREGKVMEGANELGRGISAGLKRQSTPIAHGSPATVEPQPRAKEDGITTFTSISWHRPSILVADARMLPTERWFTR